MKRHHYIIIAVVAVLYTCFLFSRPGNKNDEPEGRVAQSDPVESRSSSKTGQARQVPNSSSDGKPAVERFNWSVINETKVANIKRQLDIRIDQKISKESLRTLALKIRSQDPAQYQRTFILYFLPGMRTDAGAWASTHFDPDLDVRIIGFTADTQIKIPPLEQRIKEIREFGEAIKDRRKKGPDPFVVSDEKAQQFLKDNYQKMKLFNGTESYVRHQYADWIKELGNWRVNADVEDHVLRHAIFQFSINAPDFIRLRENGEKLDREKHEGLFLIHEEIQYAMNMDLGDAPSAATPAPKPPTITEADREFIRKHLEQLLTLRATLDSDEGKAWTQSVTTFTEDTTRHRTSRSAGNELLKIANTYKATGGMDVSFTRLAKARLEKFITPEKGVTCGSM